MKKLILCTSILLTLLNCKNETKTNSKPLTINEKIANAHGFQNWNNVSEVHFTFQVDVDTIKGNGRSWKWNPKTNNVSFTTGQTSYQYNRTKLDSTSVSADRGFTNDKFWAFIPFQLMWDKGIVVSEVKTSNAPLSNKNMQMITITYPSEGGYTPGDAYDIFFDENYIIREWSFRKSNSPQPMLSNTFENYQDFNGIKIAIDHKKDNGTWNLNFTDVKVILKE